VTFNATASRYATSYSWQLDPGTASGSRLKVDYSASPGSRVVILIVRGPGGTDSLGQNVTCP